MHSPPAVRPIEPEDWDAIERIQRASFPPQANETRAALQSLWELSPGSCRVAGMGEPVGYILAHAWIPEDLPPINEALAGIPKNSTALYIHDLALLPSARGQGAGQRLAMHVLDWARASALTTASLLSVQGTRPFWEHLGFEARRDLSVKFERTVAAYYGIDFVFMTRSL